MNYSRLVKAYIIPIAAYQAVAIAGGYGTGREVVQFFSSNGAYAGLFGLTASALLLAVVTALTFEFARLYKVYHYRSFFEKLIGPAWVLYEALYILFFLIVLAVVASAADNILQSRLGLPENVGLLLMLTLVAVLLFFGREVVERSLVVITVLLLGAFIFYFTSAYSVDSALIADSFSRNDSTDFSWLTPALQFSMYSATVAAIVLFSITGIETRTEALLSGSLCGLIVMIPGFLFHITFMGHIDELTQVNVPIYWMIDRLGIPLLLTVYIIAMFGTFLGTGLGFLQAVSDRLDAWSMDRSGNSLPRWLHACVAIGGLLISVILGQFGIIDLIAKGYGTMGWGFLIVFILPILTIGAYRIFGPAPAKI